jgi:4-diphosphocytidyl-2-C-methyl-D-erythritol kinase
MRREITLHSPAKINLHLEIGDVREDGFHDLLSLFQIVSLTDTITIRSLKDTDTCRINGDFSCSTDDNLICRAYLSLREAVGFRDGIEVDVIKRIPEGAGLGGGSSNAAATLVGINKLFGLDLDADFLAETGAGLGSDVSFFCRSPLAVVSGRGEKVLSCADPRRLPLVLVLPAFSVSTAEAYRWLDEKERNTLFTLNAAELARRYRLPVKEWGFGNSFSEVLEIRYPRIGEILEKLNDGGAEYAGVSGSGSALFAVFSAAEAARDAAAALRKEKGLKQVLIIETLDRFPVSILQ